MSVQTIHPLALALLALLVVLGVALDRILKLGLGRDIVTAHTRMIIQLTLIGFVLEALFSLESPWIALAWFAIMTLVAAAAIVHSSGLNPRRVLSPILCAVGVTAFSHLLLFIALAGRELWQARGIIPIGGMLLGNTMGSIVIGLGTFFESMRQRQALYDLRRSLGMTNLGAALPFLREGLRRSMAPQLATTATMGIVSLPGMMTGQILGGASPLTAVSYQIAIMLAIFSARLIGTLLAILAGLRSGTTRLGNLRDDLHLKHNTPKS